MRVVHFKKEPYDVYIGRPSLWGNPYTHLRVGDTIAETQVSSREEALQFFEEDLRRAIQLDREFMVEKYFRPIAGKVLGCWCPPKSCHGEVLIKLCKELNLYAEFDKDGREIE